MIWIKRIILGISFLIGLSACGAGQNHQRSQQKSTQRSKAHTFKLHVLSRDILGVKEIQFSREPGDRALYLNSVWRGTRLWRIELDNLQQRTKDKQTKVKRRKILRNGDKYYTVQGINQIALGQSKRAGLVFGSENTVENCCQLKLIRKTKSGHFGETIIETQKSPGGFSAGLVGRFNGDRYQDIIGISRRPTYVRSKNPSSSTDSFIHYFKGTAQGSFSKKHKLDMLNKDFLIGPSLDLDRDGRDEVIFYSYKPNHAVKVKVFQIKKDKIKVRTIFSRPKDHVLGLLFGDINGDQLPDVVSKCALRHSNRDKVSSCNLYINKGGLKFKKVTAEVKGYIMSDLLADLDGDQRQEIIVINESGFYAYQYKKGKLKARKLQIKHQSEYTTNPKDWSCRSADAYDFDDDGDIDFVCADSGVSKKFDGKKFIEEGQYSQVKLFENLRIDGKKKTRSKGKKRRKKK